jgi:hypothetical protein
MGCANLQSIFHFYVWVKEHGLHATLLRMAGFELGEAAISVDAQGSRGVVLQLPVAGHCDLKKSGL